MLRTRLWVGASLILAVFGVLAVDRLLPPWYPFLFVFIFGLSQAACHELRMLLRPEIRPNAVLCHAGLAGIICANWLPHLATSDTISSDPWHWIIATFAALVLIAFLFEMAVFTEPGRSIVRIALALWLFAYLGLLPSCLAQLRWIEAPGAGFAASVALALAIFTPKSCDIGAYTVGRMIGKHKMSPTLSPNKTWEGAVGGLAFAALVAISINRFGPTPVLPTNGYMEIGFGITVGLAGMFGDLAESLIKRDCQQKDASHVVPGFGGVMDVVDAVIFAAPVAFIWLI